MMSSWISSESFPSVWISINPTIRSASPWYSLSMWRANCGRNVQAWSTRKILGIGRVWNERFSRYTPAHVVVQLTFVGWSRTVLPPVWQLSNQRKMPLHPQREPARYSCQSQSSAIAVVYIIIYTPIFERPRIRPRLHSISPILLLKRRHEVNECLAHRTRWSQQEIIIIPWRHLNLGTLDCSRHEIDSTYITRTWREPAWKKCWPTHLVRTSYMCPITYRRKCQVRGFCNCKITVFKLMSLKLKINVVVSKIM